MSDKLPEYSRRYEKAKTKVNGVLSLKISKDEKIHYLEELENQAVHSNDLTSKVYKDAIAKLKEEK